MNRAAALRTAKELTLIFLMISPPAVLLITLMAGAVLWIESGSPWAGPTVMGVIVGVFVPIVVLAIRRAPRR